MSIAASIANNLKTGAVFKRTAVNNTSVSSVTSFAGVSAGALTLLATQTASSSAQLDFTSGIDSTYDAYEFHLNNIHLATDQADVQFQADTGTNTNYNLTVTNSYFRANHNEDDSASNFSIDAGRDQSQGTGMIQFMSDITDENDSGNSGIIRIFGPSSTTSVKHFLGVCNCHHHNPGGDVSRNISIGGYFNTTTAITRFRFNASSGNIDAGVIKLYGVS